MCDGFFFLKYEPLGQEEEKITGSEATGCKNTPDIDTNHHERVKIRFESD